MTRGIQTLADLYARCRHDEATGCWHWLGCIDRGGPRVRCYIDGRSHVGGGRRIALLLAGKAVAGKWTRSKVCCRSDDCVSPHHAIAESRKEHLGSMKKRGVFVPGVSGQARSAAAAARTRKLTMAEAEDVRRRAAAGQTQRALAADFQLSPATIWSLLKGRTYRRPPAASVWDWRPVATDERRAA